MRTRQLGSAVVLAIVVGSVGHSPPALATPTASAEPALDDAGSNDGRPDVPLDSSPGSDIEAEIFASDDFGGTIVIEAIEVRGNVSTSANVIARALPLAIGEAIQAGARRLRDARYKVLALGFFREVQLTMRRGAVRGQVVVVVTVVERSTIALNRLWYGTSSSTVGWLGADISERNFFGTGVTVGGGVVYARRGGIDGSRDQYAGEVRVGAAEVHGSRWSLGTALTAMHGSEPYRIAGQDRSDEPDDFAAFAYARLGARVTASYDLSAWTRLSFGVRAERVHADLPAAPIRTLPDGASIPLDLHLRDGDSDVVSASAGLDRDTRPDPVLPHAGSRLQLAVEGGVRAVAGDYHFATASLRYEHWWSRRNGNHAVGLRLGGAIAIGDTPRFDRLHLGDVDRLVTPRALGLTLSAEPAADLLGTRAEDEAYGDAGGSATFEYVTRLFRGGAHIYGGDLFIAVGAWALTSRASPPALGGGVPYDLVLDAGLRLDTEIGVFELTLANAFGRVAL